MAREVPSTKQQPPKNDEGIEDGKLCATILGAFAGEFLKQRMRIQQLYAPNLLVGYQSSKDGVSKRRAARCPAKPRFHAWPKQLSFP